MTQSDNCTSVTPACPVSDTTYGYYPTLWANTTLLVLFGALCILQISSGLLTRVYSYSVLIALGCFVEALGYVGRVILHNNPWNDSGEKIQIICLIIAPSFLAGGIYLTAKHVLSFYGSQFSRLDPKLYTWIFVGCDVGSIFLQAIGGGVAASANKTKKSVLDIGNGIIIAGIAFQVATMIICGLLVVDYIARKLRGARLGEMVYTSLEKRKVRKFLWAVCFAYITVLIRCIYRLPEMAGGWGGPMMRKEPQFLVLDGLMIALASGALTVVHPGFFFPPMKTRRGKLERTENEEELSDQNIRSPRRSR